MIPANHDVYVNPEKHNPENMIAARDYYVRDGNQISSQCTI